ncbi:polynucleotide 5'-hydroxyl-kinase NOL9-like [Biomphalaria glabrata]|uniref:Polynucleotide 5'-hydroxyl-kinase NOL9 n=1 Tax=Biomphalaria glabrata TaxID=6526 RepID=A0A9W3A725_BIOGL|nr:polynucleotide 5'-hydroxyl-kinase NOL9-like [Biomphalaria glabrata]XP_055882983.1 polynucleotide 5'-hydroxyl-kinase NOL9-like [Biomphalaria glabrata]KAI8729725.1 polynucleotide 5'-hydroxyl-kinase NOL9-like [Biomphalaria glabrata]
MSHSKRSQTSAYQVYASTGYQKSNRQSRSYDTSSRHRENSLLENEDYKRNRSSGSSKSVKKNKEFFSDSVEDFRDYNRKSFENSSTAISKMSDSKSHRHDRKDKEGIVKSTQSLMDIDFSSNRGITSAHLSKWKDFSSHHGHSSEEDQNDRHNMWKGGRKFSKYSDSEEEEDGDFWRKEKHGRNKRTWKESSSSSRHAPLIVDFPEPSHNSGKKSSLPQGKPKPLLETYIPPPVKKPVSLLDLPNTGLRVHDRAKRKNSSRMRQSDSRSDGKYDEESHQDHDLSSGKSPAKKAKLDKSELQDRHPENTKILSCKCSSSTFLIIPSCCAMTYLHGRAKLTVLLGSVSILAYKLTQGQCYDVYSPASCSLLGINVDNSQTFKSSDVRELLSKHGVVDLEKELANLDNSTVAVLRAERLESAVCDYVTSFIPYTQLFTASPARDIDQTNHKGITLPKLGLKLAPAKEMVSTCMNMSPEYEDVLVKWAKKVSEGLEGKRPPIVLCCGAKNTGKSTFNRMLLNTTLQNAESVAYLECDVGQTEFSPPGTLALHIISQPVLGAPFCHQQHAERMVFYGDASPSQDPSLYLKCLKFVFEAYKEMNWPLPLVVNTMGFPEGIGLMLLIDTMQIVEPDLVLQIESFNQMLNFPAITQEVVALDEGWSCNKLPVRDPKQKVSETKEHELMFLATLVSQRRDFSMKLKPADLRNLALLSSLSSGLERGMTLTSMPPYTVPYRYLGIHVCHHRVPLEGLLQAIDSSVVALCVTDLTQAKKENECMPYTFTEMPVCTCLGLGIVRGIDISRELLYIVTTLPKIVFRKTNTILKGNLTLPDQLILKQKSSVPIPYVDSLAPSTAVSSVRPRSRMPRSSLGAQ